MLLCYRPFTRSNVELVGRGELCGRAVGSASGNSDQNINERQLKCMRQRGYYPLTARETRCEAQAACPRDKTPPHRHDRREESGAPAAQRGVNDGVREWGEAFGGSGYQRIRVVAQLERSADAAGRRQLLEQPRF
jgi:hypothetical protein